jgi:hypothetical protein
MAPLSGVIAWCADARIGKGLHNGPAGIPRRPCSFSARGWSLSQPQASGAASIHQRGAALRRPPRDEIVQRLGHARVERRRLELGQLALPDGMRPLGRGLCARLGPLAEIRPARDQRLVEDAPLAPRMANDGFGSKCEIHRRSIDVCSRVSSRHMFFRPCHHRRRLPIR